MFSGTGSLSSAKQLRSMFTMRGNSLHFSSVSLLSVADRLPLFDSPRPVRRVMSSAVRLFLLSERVLSSVLSPLTNSVRPQPTAYRLLSFGMPEMSSRPSGLPLSCRYSTFGSSGSAMLDTLLLMSSILTMSGLALKSACVSLLFVSDTRSSLGLREKSTAAMSFEAAVRSISSGALVTSISVTFSSSSLALSVMSRLAMSGPKSLTTPVPTGFPCRLVGTP